MIVSIRTKLTIWYSITICITLIVFSMGIHSLVRGNLIDGLDQTLQHDIDRIKVALLTDLQSIVELDSLNIINLFHIAQKDWVVYSSERWPDIEFDRHPSKAGYYSHLSNDQQSYRVVNQSITIQKQNYQIQVAHNSSQIETSIHQLNQALIFGIPVVLLFALSGGYVIAGKTLSPLRKMTEQICKINADRLDQRINVDNTADEIGQLSSALNHSFSRLEDAFKQLRRFTADASHEFRTPLSVIRTIGELALVKHSEPAAYCEDISSMLEEVDRLGTLIDNLLILARADTETYSVDKTSTDLVIILRDVVDCLQILAHEKAQTIELDLPKDAFLFLHAESIRRALLNILDNAIRYTPLQGKINLCLKKTKSHVELVIADNGPGIPQAYRERIFDRFYRIDFDRSRQTGGTGLGLSICRSAINANCGHIRCFKNPSGGTLFKIVFDVKNQYS